MMFAATGIMVAIRRLGALLPLGLHGAWLNPCLDSEACMHATTGKW